MQRKEAAIDSVFGEGCGAALARDAVVVPADLDVEDEVHLLTEHGLQDGARADADLTHRAGAYISPLFDST